MSRVTERASSIRQEKRNQLSPSRAKILVFVESTADISFWHGILSPYEKQIKMKFDVSAFPHDDLTTGKDVLISNFYKTGIAYLICLDSDYDYILQTELAQAIKNNPFIFQTYAYAMENLKCYAETLNALCVKSTNNTDELIDLVDFLTQYSKIIYPLLLWNLYYYKTNNYSQFSINDFCEIVKIDIAPDNYLEKLDSLNVSIAKRLNSIINENMTNFSNQLALLGLNETNAYLFMNGHALYDFIKALLTKICEVLKNNRKYEIQELAENLPEDKRAETCNAKIGEYFKLVSVGYLLEHNDKFTDCFLFQKIKTDIETYLETFKQQTQGLNHV